MKEAQVRASHLSATYLLPICFNVVIYTYPKDSISVNIPILILVTAWHALCAL